ncbi:hypothetical protein AQZ52_10215 [Novosphingobium fuchskuhlense]|uniref:DUF4349 domain-containing protein n=1 Tax=Novosphingobium fuchskuhlense TaxID=1117702 RepID=A0A124JUB6_9SPHN|nr:hypothetical protein AQZ52_10215 [Novosphingobium fuchskuhlense]
MLLALAGCSEKAPEAPYEAPSVSPKSAPGVAFTYYYDFLLPNTAVASIQEQHASACEKLGPARCRIKGLEFRVGRGEDTRASLDLLLDRDLARSFGKEGVAAVVQAGGQLSSQTITGEDLAPKLAQAAQAAAEAEARLIEIDQRLKQPGLGDRERTQLQEEASTLRRDKSNAKVNTSDAQVQLASTPMHLHYQGIAALAISDNPFAGAIEAMMSSGRMMVWTVLLGLGTAVPWILLLLACLLVWRLPSVRRLIAIVSGTKPPTKE